MITFVTGDLFAAIANKPHIAIAHGCNGLGVMGAGFAKEVARRYPACARSFANAFKDGRLSLGGCYMWNPPPLRPIVFNLVTQPKPGPCAKIEYIRSSCQSMTYIAGNFNCVEIAMPRIGCGLGGLQWSDVQPVLVELFEPWTGTATVYSLKENSQ